jgi:hypothetical protein
MKAEYFEARQLEDPKHPNTSAWYTVTDDDGEPVRGDTEKEVRERLLEIEKDELPMLVIAHVKVTYIRV